jgi:hypothetical protein
LWRERGEKGEIGDLLGWRGCWVGRSDVVRRVRTIF